MARLETAVLTASEIYARNHQAQSARVETLRARFAEAGGAALADYELLELFLFRSIPRRDVKPVAKALIA
ncbi:MAG: hypothetical protein V7698_07800, partial [Paracoccaceae bacterium]